MLSYTIPKPEKGDMKQAVAVGEGYRPTVYLEVSKEIVEALEIGDMTKIIIEGKVTVLESRSTEKNEGRNEIQLELHKISVDAGNEFEDLLEDGE